MTFLIDNFITKKKIIYKYKNINITINILIIPEFGGNTSNGNTSNDETSNDEK